MYGQHFVENIVANAVKGHLNAKPPKSALAFSFHGLPGIGKNYVTNFLAKSIFKKGTESVFYKYYNGRIHFPRSANSVQYQVSYDLNKT